MTDTQLAAGNGVSMGGGFEIALACDLIIASEKATFALPEPRVGLAALAGGGDVWSVAFSPDGATLAAGNRDGSVLLWDLDVDSPAPDAAQHLGGGGADRAHAACGRCENSWKGGCSRGR